MDLVCKQRENGVYACNYIDRQYSRQARLYGRVNNQYVCLVSSIDSKLMNVNYVRFQEEKKLQPYKIQMNLMQGKTKMTETRVSACYRFIDVPDTELEKHRYEIYEVL